MGDKVQATTPKARTSRKIGKPRLEAAVFATLCADESQRDDEKDAADSDGLTTLCSLDDIYDINCKWAEGRLVGDAGPCSGSKASLAFYEASEDGWLMLGHGVGKDMVLVEEGSLVRRAERWTRCWSNGYSGAKNDCSIYIPQCDDPDFLACGVVFVFGTGCWKWGEPRLEMPIALIHRSVVKPACLLSNLWSDDGTGSPHSVTLKASPHMGTAWPSSASLLDRLPIAHEIKPCYMQKIPYLRSFLPLLTQRTFVDICVESDDEDVAFVKRKPRAKSCPPLCNSLASRSEEAEEDQREFVSNPPGTAAPAPSPRTQSPQLSGSSTGEASFDPSSEMESFLQQVFMKLVILSEPSIPDLGTKELPSVGSAAHYRGACKPCAFAGDNCRNGTKCAFCHLCMPKQKKRGRWNLKRQRKSSELNTDFAVLGKSSGQEDEKTVTGVGAAGSAEQAWAGHRVSNPHAI
jgi:hypothetical protein